MKYYKKYRMELLVTVEVAKKTVMSGIQTSGTITLGNYLGALNNWVNMQDDYDCIFFLANLHAITVRQDPAKLKQNTMEAYALLLACGINPEKSLFFVQSQVPSHTQLSWILNCFTQFGELSRMTQFKDKSQKHKDNINCGLFSYPCLMAADILLYQADLVPTGKDQKQHVELTRIIAERFNGIYGETFKVPAPYISETGAKIMSLTDPAKKMSKSDGNPNSYIAVLDSPDVIMKKFSRSVTDSEARVHYQDGKDGINNLMTIYSIMTGHKTEEIESEFENKGYKDFKCAVAEIVINKLEPIQRKFSDLMKEKSYLKQCCNDAALKAEKIARKTLDEVMAKVGLLV